MQEVIITVDENASVTVEAKGVVGSGCAALTKAIEQDLGVVTTDVKKAEYHQQARQTVGQQAKAGR